MSTSSTMFSGNSRFANDFKSIIDRSVAIASLPLTQMQQEKLAMSDESAALDSLDARFTSIQTAIDAIASATTSGTYASKESDSSLLSATLGGTPLTGTYSIEVTSYGAYTTANSSAGFTTISDPATTSLSPASSFTLTTGSGEFTITPSANTLNALADAINETTSADVRATIVNFGNSSSPVYRLSLQSTKLGSADISLSDSVVETQTATEVTSRSGLSFTAEAKFTLAVDGQKTTLTGATDLDGLVNQINVAAIAGISAAKINLGTVEAPDWRLQITRPDGTNVDLTENLVETKVANRGSQAGYKINGSDEILTDTRTITIAPGLTADIKRAPASGDSAVTVTVSRSTSGISDAIASFVTAYNTAATEITKHHQAAKSALAGSSILSAGSNALRSLVTFSSAGHFTSLVSGYSLADSDQDIGLTVDNFGKLSFDKARFSANTDGNLTDLLALLGDTSTSGFLKTATDALKSLQDPTSGALDTAIASVKDQISRQDDRIADKQDQIDTLQKNLEAQMAASDAAIAMLEQQSSFFTNMFAAMKEASSSSK